MAIPFEFAAEQGFYLLTIHLSHAGSDQRNGLIQKTKSEK